MEIRKHYFFMLWYDRQHLYVADCREKAESATRDSDIEAEKQLAGGLRGHVTGDKMPFTDLLLS